MVRINGRLGLTAEDEQLARQHAHRLGLSMEACRRSGDDLEVDITHGDDDPIVALQLLDVFIDHGRGTLDVRMEAFGDGLHVRWTCPERIEEVVQYYAVD